MLYLCLVYRFLVFPFLLILTFQNAQADMGFRCTHMSEDMFSYGVAQVIITETYLFNFDPHLYCEKWGLQGYTLFFLYLLKNIDCRGGFLMSIHNLCFEQKNNNNNNNKKKKNQNLFIRYCSIYLNKRV